MVKTSRKVALVKELAAVMTNNWIATGDRTESQRAVT